MGCIFSKRTSPEHVRESVMGVVPHFERREPFAHTKTLEPVVIKICFLVGEGKSLERISIDKYGERSKNAVRPSDG